MYAASAANVRFWIFQSRKFGGDTVCRPPRIVSLISTMAAGAAYGSGRSSTAWTTLKIAVFAPMPSASAAADTTVKPGLLRSMRKAKRKSWSSMERPPE
jgi:hypothetical protein